MHSTVSATAEHFVFGRVGLLQLAILHVCTLYCNEQYFLLSWLSFRRIRVFSETGLTERMG